MQTSCIKKSKLIVHYFTRSSVKPSTLSSQVTTRLNIRGHDDFDEIDCLDVWNPAKLFLTIAFCTLSSQVTTRLNIRGHDDFDEIDCLDVWNPAKLFLTIAFRVMSVPASSAPVESVFSLILIQFRLNLRDKMLTSIIFIKKAIL